ncbi:hypothetical protein [Streptomyces sp. NPDC057496]|uniref:hypothetical protein n=1 Tax=Streptomyces sp. NPDC057496 TaxID=3346149 RepID=UPI0036B34046
MSSWASPRPYRGQEDREQVVRWCREFCVDVGEQVSIALIDAGFRDNSRFGERHFRLWKTPSGHPVSMAAATSIVGGMMWHQPGRSSGAAGADAVLLPSSACARLRARSSGSGLSHPARTTAAGA